MPGIAIKNLPAFLSTVARSLPRLPTSPAGFVGLRRWAGARKPHALASWMKEAKGFGGFRLIPRLLSRGASLLEFMVYLGITALLLYGVFTLVLSLTILNGRLERAIASECALHNAIVIFRRDSDLMPRALNSYLQLQPDRIRFTSLLGDQIMWYFSKNRLVRSQYHKKGWEHAVVLEPAIDASFTPIIKGNFVRALKLTLSHNELSINHTLWISNHA